MLSTEDQLRISASRISELEDRLYDLEMVLKTILITHAGLIENLNIRLNNVENSTGAKPD